MNKLLLIILVILVIAACHGKDNNKGYKENKKAYLNLPPFFKGKIAFQSDEDGDNEIYILNEEGIKKLTDNTYQDEYPVLSEDGQKIIFQANPKGNDNYDIFIMNSDGTSVMPIIASNEKESEASFCNKDNTQIIYTKNDKEIYLYDMKRNENLPLLEPSRWRTIVPMCSLNDDFILFTRKRLLGWDVAMIKKYEKEVKFLTEGGKSCRARWSHQGNKIAFVSTRKDKQGDIWIMNFDGSYQERITYDDSLDYYPDWSADDKYIVFSSSLSKSKNLGIWIIDVRTKHKWLIYDSTGDDKFPSWSK